MIMLNGNYVGAAELLRLLDEGEVNALDVKILLKQLERQIEFVTEEVNRMALEEASKYGQKVFAYKGAMIELAEMGTRYIFNNCGYPILHRIEASKKDVLEAEKSAQGWLKSLKGKVEFIDPETGEMCEVYPPAKISTSGIKITLPK